MIKFENVDYSYSSKRVINNLSFEIADSGVYGLLGENGTGKTTMINLIAGLLCPYKGSVSVFGYKSFDKDVEMYKELFIVPEEFSLPNMSFEKYIKTYSLFYPNFSHEQVQDYCSRFKLDMTQRLDRMSMGQRKKCLLSFCFASNCKTLILDEPTNGLDIPSKMIFRSIVADMATEERIIIISTHQIRDIDSILDSLIIIDNENMLLKSSIARLESKLSFVDASCATNPIYTEGNVAIVPNDGENETSVSIEVLFNAVVVDASKINELIK